MTKRRHHGEQTKVFHAGRKPVAAHFNNTAERTKSSFLSKHGKHGARKNHQGK